MFASPAVRPFSQENVDSVVKKPGNLTASVRKAFADRNINVTSPINSKDLKGGQLYQTPAFSKQKSPKFVEEDDLSTDDVFCSYKDVPDSYEDIPVPKIDRSAMLRNILTVYCGVRDSATPPPELDIDLFSELPTNDNFLLFKDNDVEFLPYKIPELSPVDFDLFMD